MQDETEINHKNSLKFNEILKEITPESFLSLIDPIIINTALYFNEQLSHISKKLGVETSFVPPDISLFILAEACAKILNGMHHYGSKESLKTLSEKYLSHFHTAIATEFASNPPDNLYSGAIKQ